MKYLRVLVFIAMTIPALSYSATVSDSVVITHLISDYMPDMLRVRIDRVVGNCNTGTWINRYGQGNDEATKRRNNEITFSALLAALLSKRKVNIYLNNDDCTIQNLQFTDES